MSWEKLAVKKKNGECFQLLVVIQTFPSLFSTLLCQDLDIDPLQSTTGTGGESNTLVPDCCLILRGQRRVTFFVIGQQRGNRTVTDSWESKSDAWERKMSQLKLAQRVGVLRWGKGCWGEVTRASQGLTQSDRLAGTNTQTHRAFMAGCSAEHTQCAACWEQEERETIDKRPIHRKGMRAWAAKEERRARWGTTGAFRFILLHRERETPFVAQMWWKFPYFSDSLLDYYSVHLHIRVAKDGGLCFFNMIWKIHFHKAFLFFPLYSRECIRKPDLSCLESTALNFICIPQIPWLVGALIPWHITQSDPHRRVHPHSGQRCTVGALLRTDRKGFPKHFHIPLVRCLVCAHKSVDSLSPESRARQLKKELLVLITQST